jgi:carboxyl-terminal processing protease
LTQPGLSGCRAVFHHRHRGRLKLRWVPLLVGLAAGALPPGQALAVAPVEEIREILRSELFPEPTGAALQLLSPANLDPGLKRLDPYAAWYPVDTGQNPHGEEISVAGIGARLEVADGRAWLLPRQASPLARAGLSDRVELISVDGRAVTDLDAVAIAALVHGEPGTEVHLVVKPGDDRGGIDLRLRRERVRPLDVELWRTGEFGVLRITDFVAGRTRTALGKTLDFLATGTGRLAIDLRYAGGGDLYEAIDAAGILLEQGTVLCTLHGREDVSVTLYAPAAFETVSPLLLLVGPSTASAAEVFAGILQYHRRAVLVGQPTFGKCHSQTERRLRDGSVLRFTNREVRFPDGRSCSGVGLTPDLPVPDDVVWDLERILPYLSSIEDGSDTSVQGFRQPAPTAVRHPPTVPLP